VFQSFRLIPWATIQYRNVEFALESNCRSRAENGRNGRGTTWRWWGCRALSTAIPRSSRAACASAWRWPGRLAVEPQLLLMDEPFASLDAQTRELMQMELMEVWSRRRAMVLFVTHSVDEAILLADSVDADGRAARS
jgi:NitT/TauT family transport system ATP-binding protein